MFSQNKFDQVVKKRRKQEELEQFDEKRLENFADKSLDEKYQIVMDMPLTLQLELLGDAGIFEDENTTISHKCKLKKYKDIDSKQWICSRANKEGKRCMYDMKDKKDSKYIQGWRCKKPDCKHE